MSGMTSMLSKKIDSRLFNKFAQMIDNIAGIHLEENKRTLLSNRLRKRLKETGIKSFEEYYSYLEKGEDPGEIDQMLNAVSTNETYFFRNSVHFQALEEYIIPGLLKNNNSSLKILSAGCSSGEEPYSIALMAAENGWLRPGRVKITGFDLNSLMIEAAAAGIYDSKKFRQTDEKYLRKYFNPVNENKYELDKNIRTGVGFSKKNLIKDKIAGEYDIILCRNVMIYFNKDNQKKVIGKFYEALKPGGFLIIGHSESLYFLDQRLKYKKIMEAPVYYKPGSLP